MTSPTRLKQETLAALRGTRRDMSSAAWLSSLAGQPPEVRRKAAFAMLEVEQAILALGNGKLAEIGASLQENEEALRTGRAGLIRARKHLGRAGSVLAATARLLDVIARVVRLPAGLS